MRVIAFTRYGSLAASTRQRLLQYVPALAAAGIHVDYHPLLGQDYVRSLATGERYSRLRIAASYLRRMKQLLSVGDADLIWVYAELFPYLPGWFERLAARSGKPVVYDFDDAFFHLYDDHRNQVVRRLLRGKLEPLLRTAAACCCGNEYLFEYAVRYCANSTVLPTVVDTQIYTPSPSLQESGPAVIGWIGSPSTWPYMRPYLPLFRELAAEEGATLRVIGAGRAADADRFEGLELVDWSEVTEIDEVRRMNIGVMPLPDERWARGKSGYKLIQYMACAVPVVASPVGVNSQIVGSGRVGFLTGDIGEWRAALIRLIRDPQLRRQMGEAGRSLAVEHYSVQRHAPRLIEVLSAAAPLARNGSANRAAGIWP
jgi:glycosyltransferase involved in cell wall biosynthesis